MALVKMACVKLQCSYHSSFTVPLQGILSNENNVMVNKESNQEVKP